MDYMLTHGRINANIVRDAMRFGKPIPDRIANAPELRPGLQLYLQAFFDLDSERNHAFSPTPIPWSSIKEYAKLMEFDDEQTADLFFFINKMDEWHLNRLEQKTK